MASSSGAVCFLFSTPLALRALGRISVSKESEHEATEERSEEHVVVPSVPPGVSHPASFPIVRKCTQCAVKDM